MYSNSQNKTPEAADRSLRNGERSIRRPNGVVRGQPIDKIKEILAKGAEENNSKISENKATCNHL